MPTFAAVDIGANSVRLSIARFSGQRRAVIHEEREVTRLGEAVFREGRLAPEAMARTVKVLRRFHRATQTHGADQTRVVATSPLRDARNAQALIDWVRTATGWTVEVISGLEEGRLIHLGIVTLTRLRVSRALLVDLGGGSCEFTIAVDGHIRRMHSLSLGAVRLSEEFLRRDPPKKKELARLGEYVGGQIERIAPEIRAAKPQLMLATSGTAAALAALARAAALPNAGARAGRGTTVTRAATLRLYRELGRAPRLERAALPGIGPRRAEIIVAGAAVFADLLVRCGIPSFRYSPLGLRDGVLAQMAADRDRRARRHIDAERRDALLAAGVHYAVDAAHAAQVRGLAGELFRALRKLHRLPLDWSEWLGAAAMLYEVGNYINRSGSRRHSYYIIAHSEIFGYTPQQRRLIAAIVRYQGRSRPSADHQAVRALAIDEQLDLPKAVMLLRLARALDQGRRGAAAAIQVRVYADRVAIAPRTKPVAGPGAGDLERWALEKERAAFRAVFGRELAVGGGAEC